MIEESSTNGTDCTVDASAGRLADFLIIGAMRAGTTSLYRYLCRHPQVFMSTPKEPMFFSRTDVFARGEGWYRSLFNGASEEQICGEASTCYSRCAEYPEAPSRIAKLLPSVRLIYIMRHPVDRAYSTYSFILDNLPYGTQMSFAEATEEYTRAVIDASLYIDQIRCFLPYFSRERFLFLTFDDFTEDPPAVLKSIQEFLGLEVVDLCSADQIVANVGGYTSARRRISEGLSSLRALPLVSQMVDVLRQSWRTRARTLLTEGLVRSAMGRRIIECHQRTLAQLQPDARERLVKFFEPSLVELEKFLDRELPTWHQ